MNALYGGTEWEKRNEMNSIFNPIPEINKYLSVLRGFLSGANNKSLSIVSLKQKPLLLLKR